MKSERWHKLRDLSQQYFESGDVTHFGEIYRILEPKIRSCLNFRFKAESFEVINDIIAETLARLQKSLRTKLIDNVEAYAVKTATNLLRNKYRDDNRRLRLLGLRAEEVTPVAFEDDPTEGMSLLEEYNSLLELIENLSPDHQEILRLKYIEDMAHAEIAKILGIPQGTVMSRLSRAHEALRILVRATGGQTTSKRQRGKNAA